MNGNTPTVTLNPATTMSISSPPTLSPGLSANLQLQNPPDTAVSDLAQPWDLDSWLSDLSQIKDAWGTEAYVGFPYSIFLHS